MQRSRVWNTKIVDRRLFRVCSMKGDYRTPMTQAFLSLSLSLSRLFLFFTAIADDNSRQGCATRSAINTTERYPPLAAFSIRGWWFHVPTCCFSIPCYGNGEGRKKRSRTFRSYDFKFDGGGGFGFGVKMASDFVYGRQEVGNLKIETCWNLLMKYLVDALFFVIDILLLLL